MSKTETMEEADDDDLKLQRASVIAINDIVKGVAALVRVKGDASIVVTTSSLKSNDIVHQLQIFQEDPQLLDPHLRYIIPPLASLFLSFIKHHDADNENSASIDTVAEILYNLCKIRGEKVISRFLDNEPRFIVPMLKACVVSFPELHNVQDVTDTDGSSVPQISWERRYVLLLWLNHLILTPFDLSTISGERYTQPNDKSYTDIQLPPLAADVLELCLTTIGSATKEQTAAASLLVRLCLRPDMLKLGLLAGFIRRTLKLFGHDREEPDSTHNDIGGLLFLNGIIRGADLQSISQFLPEIYDAIEVVFTTEAAGFQILRTSAVPKKLSIKIQRNIVVQLRKARDTNDMDNEIVRTRMDEMGVLERVIDFLMTSLADRDTQVRYAASKSLAVITTKLDKEMADDIMQAILESYNEDLVFEEGSTNFSAVDPQRWHGLNLTLSHLLFRSSASPALLPDILTTLYLALTFEQRSPTGNSTGGNVRDAANFGLWSLARRYTTAELMSVGNSIPTSKSTGELTINALQQAAYQLLTTACLDSIGNVRRGSSAALQELIGRHPNTIFEGISLVQIVDYQAVGLRSRAMTEVAVKAALLHPSYREVLLENLHGWRGVKAPDARSRRFAAVAVGSLTCLYGTDQDFLNSMDDLTIKFKRTKTRDVEERHGLLLSLAAILNQYIDNTGEASESADVNGIIASVARLWDLFKTTIRISPKELLLSSLRSELHVEALIALIAALTNSLLKLIAKNKTAGNDNTDTKPNEEAVECFSSCIAHSEAASVDTLPFAATGLLQSFDTRRREEIVESWITTMKLARAPNSLGLMLALGSSWDTLFQQERLENGERSIVQDTILQELTLRTAAAEVEVRVHAIRSLTLIVQSSKTTELKETALGTTILEAFHLAMNDYTINERGDVGSLVRLEALVAMTSVWDKSSINGNCHSEAMTACVWDAFRLALEKLDKVRLQAARCLRASGVDFGNRIENLADVSSYDYFVRTSILILSRMPASKSPRASTPSTEAQHTTLLSGFATSAGSGAESLQQPARSALHDVLTALPLYPHPQTSTSNPEFQPLPTLVSLATSFLTLLSSNLTNDRLLHPLLELLAFLLEANVFHPLLDPASHQPTPVTPATPATTTTTTTTTTQRTTSFKPLALLSLVQKSHFKSSSLPKLIACVSIYRALADIPALRTPVLTKLVSMLSHPFPRVRIASAEALWVVTEDGGLKGWDWAGEGTGEAGRRRAGDVKARIVGGNV